MFCSAKWSQACILHPMQWFLLLSPFAGINPKFFLVAPYKIRILLYPKRSILVCDGSSQLETEDFSLRTGFGGPPPTRQPSTPLTISQYSPPGQPDTGGPSFCFQPSLFSCKQRCLIRWWEITSHLLFHCSNIYTRPQVSAWTSILPSPHQVPPRLLLGHLPQSILYLSVGFSAQGHPLSH